MMNEEEIKLVRKKYLEQLDAIVDKNNREKHIERILTLDMVLDK